MNVLQIRTYLKDKDSVPPVTTPEYEEWLECADALEFLVSSATDHVPIYVSSKYFYLYAVLIPKQRLKGEYVADLMQWNFAASTGWGYSIRFTSRRPTIEPPLDCTGSSILDGGEPIFFLRNLYEDDNSYLEVNQKLAHLLEVHQVNQRNAYCKIDKDTGDLVDVITFSQDDGILCTMDRAALDSYLFLTNSVLIRVFDVTRWGGSFSGWQGDIKKDIYTDKVHELYAQRSIKLVDNGKKEAGYVRGIQIIRQDQPNSKLMREFSWISKKKKEYATFIALDWKHEKVQECSCDPEKLGNFFVESDLPYELTPAFFNPEVVLRYKQYPDKYTIDFETISCRNTWNLRYRTNDTGQIQVYLIDLAHLPTREQLYWKTFNEKPKAGVAERVYKRDFLGSWDPIPNPLGVLKHTISKFPRIKYQGEEIAIMRCPTEKQLAKLTYVMTDSRKEWEDQILELAKLFGDGLDKKELRKVSKYLRCDDSQLGSMNLLKKCLETRGLDTEDVQCIMQPWQTLYGLRSSGIAHTGRNAPDVNLKDHHKHLVEDCSTSLKQLAELIRTGYLDIP